jgi:hypothetical protein
MKPIWDRVAADIKDEQFYFSDNDEDKQPTEGIKGVPMIFLVDRKGLRHRYPGGPDYDQLKNWILAFKKDITVFNTF